MSRRVLSFLLVLVFAASSAAADVELWLEDGRMVRARDVKRRGDEYVAELPSGEIETFPLEQVEKLILIGSPASSRGKAEQEESEAPRQLSGPRLEPQDPSEQRQALDEANAPRRTSIDPVWTPHDDLPRAEIVPHQWNEPGPDAWWTPSDDLPRAEIVPHIWSEPSPGSTWQPEDALRRASSWNLAAARRIPSAFQPGRAPRSVLAHFGSEAPLPSYPPLLSESVIHLLSSRRSRVQFSNFERWVLAPVPRSTRARRCAQELLEVTGTPTSLDVTALDEARFAALPIPIYRGTASVDGGASWVLFTTAGGRCRMLSGDKQLLGVTLASEHRITRAVSAYDAALGDVPSLQLESAQELFRYALAVSALVNLATDTDVTDRYELLTTASALDRLVRQKVPSCSITRRQQRQSVKRAVRRFSPPEIVQGNGGRVVRFLSWSSAAGNIYSLEILVTEFGRVSLHREIIAGHLGPHQD
ncbi:MAG: hypothetical protein JSV80_00540 [Acidobacteriota bacterium]|nr:MAG: hypothetical protein JSV80_00540 [Acidobacteriota bacterium]